MHRLKTPLIVWRQIEDCFLFAVLVNPIIVKLRTVSKEGRAKFNSFLFESQTNHKSSSKHWFATSSYLSSSLSFLWTDRQKCKNVLPFSICCCVVFLRFFLTFVIQSNSTDNSQSDLGRTDRQTDKNVCFGFQLPPTKLFYGVRFARS